MKNQVTRGSRPWWWKALSAFNKYTVGFGLVSTHRLHPRSHFQMDKDELDTDTLIVMLRSLLDGLEVSNEDLLIALTAARGDIHKAASKIRQEGSSSSSERVQDASSKRKKPLSISQWLKSPNGTESSIKRRRVENVTPEPREVFYVSDSSDSESPKWKSPKYPTKPVKNLNDVLRPPPSTRPSAPKLPPMTLGTPDVIAKHTPTTMHHNILPPEMACRLFYVMLDEAEARWRRSTWFLGGCS